MINYGTVYLVETDLGLEVVPEEICGHFSTDGYDADEATEFFANHVEGISFYSVAREEGYYTQCDGLWVFNEDKTEL